MSIYHLDISNVSRATNGNAVSSLAYISGDEITDEMTGEKKKYKREDEVLAKKNIVPDDAPARYKEHAANWCNDIEQIEQAENARTAKRIRMALPEEMTLEEQQRAIDRWIFDNCTKHGYPATYAIHAGKVSISESGERHQNRHVHILVANRPLENGEWAKVKNKKVYKLDEYGERVPKLATDEDGNAIPIRDQLGRQVRDEYGRPKFKQLEKTGKDGRTRKQWQRVSVSQNPLDKMSTLKSMRKSWAEVCNQYLSPDNWIDHRSNEERGLQALPTRHEGYKARAIEKRGGIADICEENRQIRANNAALPQLKAQIANQKYNIMVERGKLDTLKASYNKVSGVAGQAVGAVKGAISQGIGSILGQSDGKGMQGVMDRTAQEIGKALAQGNIAGAGLAVAKMPLDVLKNVESEDVKRDKLREQAEKAQAEEGILGMGGSKKKRKDKGKGKGQGQAEHAPLVRSRGGR